MLGVLLKLDLSRSKVLFLLPLGLTNDDLIKVIKQLGGQHMAVKLGDYKRYATTGFKGEQGSPEATREAGDRTRQERLKNHAGSIGFIAIADPALRPETRRLSTEARVEKERELASYIAGTIVGHGMIADGSVTRIKSLRQPIGSLHYLTSYKDTLAKEMESLLHFEGVNSEVNANGALTVNYGPLPHIINTRKMFTEVDDCMYKYGDDLNLLIVGKPRALTDVFGQIMDGEIITHGSVARLEVNPDGTQTEDNRFRLLA